MQPRIARIHIRSSKEEKTQFEEAAAIEGEELSEFLRKSAHLRAKQIIEEHNRLTLSNNDRDSFLNALVKPPKSVTRLKAAMKRYRKNARKD